jgi:hypothetical protein
MGIATTSRFFDGTAALRERVEQFLETAHDISRLDFSARIDAVERTVSFLADVLLPHAYAEERVLYPEASRLLGERDASDIVARDRAEIRRLIRELVSADPRDAGRLEELLYALYALLGSHFWRGDALYLRLLSDQPDARVRQLLARVGGYEAHRRFRRAPRAQRRALFG